MSFVEPTVEDFKTRFARDFPFGIDQETTVLDSDIERAYILVRCNINQGLFCDQECFSQAFLLLAAHYLVTNLRSSSQGLSGNYEWLTSSKSVGSVSVSSSIPDSILRNPYYSMISKTNYGAEYLMMIYPLLSGQIFTVPGATRP